MNPVPAGGERRVHHELREVFDEAYARVEPMLDAAGDSGDATLRIQWLLREAYPQLSPSERFLFVFAARRMHAQRWRQRGPDRAIAA
jgi:hypothetical protein